MISPLDWGLGHTTRCIPLIRFFLQHQFEVFVGAEGSASMLISQAFPDISILPLKGYRIKYSKQKAFFLTKLLLQLPRIQSAINYENKWLNKVIDEHNIDLVISDNRLGLYTKKAQTVFITHQLRIQSGINWLDALIQKINYHYINRFSECWVPDIKGDGNLAGALSHPEKLPKIPVKYIGWLSRFIKKEQPKKYKFVVVLSGPEPQRTIFEKKIIQQENEFDGITAIVRGLPQGNETLPFTNPLITCFNHLPADELSELMQQAELVISRSGYSTIMDLITIQQKAVLVPTPGQTEQEYLAKYLAEKKLFNTVSQERFSIKAIAEGIKQK